MPKNCISIYNEFSNIGPTRTTWTWRIKVKSISNDVVNVVPLHKCHVLTHKVVLLKPFNWTYSVMPCMCVLVTFHIWQ